MCSGTNQSYHAHSVLYNLYIYIYIYIYICILIKLSDNKLFFLHSVAAVAELLARPVQLDVDNKEGAQLLCKQKGMKHMSACTCMLCTINTQQKAVIYFWLLLLLLTFHTLISLVVFFCCSIT